MTSTSTTIRLTEDEFALLYKYWKEHFPESIRQVIASISNSMRVYELMVEAKTHGADFSEGICLKDEFGFIGYVLDSIKGTR